MSDREQQEKYPAEKWCCTVCAQKRRCSICDVETTTACSDCAIDLRATVYVCSKATCRKAHDAKCPHELAERVIALERALRELLRTRESDCAEYCGGRCPKCRAFAALEGKRC